MGLIAIVPHVEAISFGLWSSMPMGAHKSRTTKHHHGSGKGITAVNIEYKVPTHSLNIQIILQIYIWETTSIVHANKRLTMHNNLHYCCE